MWEDSESASIGGGGGKGGEAFPALTDCVSTGFIIQPADAAIDYLSLLQLDQKIKKYHRRAGIQGQTTPVGVRRVERDVVFALAAVASFGFDRPTEF